MSLREKHCRFHTGHDHLCVACLNYQLDAAEARVAELTQQVAASDRLRYFEEQGVELPMLCDIVAEVDGLNAKLALALAALRRIYTGRHTLNAVEMSCIAAEGALEGAGGAGEPSVTGTIARTADDGERRGNIHPKGKP